MTATTEARFSAPMTRERILGWLREENEEALSRLWGEADAVRRDQVGDAVHLRGLIEVSNHCVRQCAYCGIRAGNPHVERYRMTAPEIVSCAHQAVHLGYGTVVLQSGEDYGLTQPWVVDVVSRIKGETPLAVTLSLGERPEKDLAAWREAGADRYLLRFETSNRRLYDRIHPPRGGRRSDRIALLRAIRDLGYEAGGGMMVGIPGQTYDDLAADIELLRELDPHMIGLGPYIPHPQTPLGMQAEAACAPEGEQVPNSELMTYKCLALARLVCPMANIPSTTALALVTGGVGRQLGLERGANVIMPNLTPREYRRKYEIYPAKGQVEEATEEGDRAVRESIRAVGRTIGTGPGPSPRYLAEATAPTSLSGG